MLTETVRCGTCKNCKNLDKQRAAFRAAISEATPTIRELHNMSESDKRKFNDVVDGLKASWNAMQVDPDYKCEAS